MIRALIYADSSLNLIDGSSIWLTSIAEAMSRCADHVTVLLKEPIKNDRLLSRITQFPNITVENPTCPNPGRSTNHGANAFLSPREAAQRVLNLDRATPFDLILVRGFKVSHEMAQQPQLADRLWSYITDLPHPLQKATPPALEALTTVARASAAMFAQTEDARSYLEGLCPAACGKTYLMPPMVPDEAFRSTPVQTATEDTCLRLVYAGKLAAGWRTLEMLELPKLLKAQGVESELWVIGDKINESATDPQWASRMRNSLTQAAQDPSSGIRWFGGLSRQESLRLVAQCHVGLGWRTADLDGGLELSTKLLEYCAVNVVPVVNDTPAHRDLLQNANVVWVKGSTTTRMLATQLAALRESPSLPKNLAQLVRDKYSMAAAAQALNLIISRKMFAKRKLSIGTQARHILVVSHDLKFLGELLPALKNTPGVTVDIDEWQSLRDHDAAFSLKKLHQADTIFCEWAGPNLVWASQHASENQHLVSRLHGFELRGDWLNRAALDRLSILVTVSDDLARRATDQLALTSDRVITIPNMVDTHDMSRPKLPGHQFRLGLLGWVGYNKRPDRALDLLQALLRRDCRYSLHIKGRPPWEYPYEWNDGRSRQLYLEFFARLAADSRLAQQVSFEPYSADIGSWLRKIGFVLSSSDQETFHLAPAEGMASGAIPVIWRRAGADRIFPERWIITSTKEAADLVTDLREPVAHQAAVSSCQQHSLRWDPTSVLKNWMGVLFP